MAARLRIIVPGLLAALTLASCEMEERVVGMDTALTGLQGAQSQLPPTSDRNPASAAIQHVRPEIDRDKPKEGEPVDPNRNPLRNEKEDGSVELLTFAPRHLVTHLRQTMLKEEYDLLYEQLISERTKEEYVARRRDPTEVRDWFQRNRRAVLTFLAKMPLGEQTPGLFMRHIGGGVYRLQLPNKAGTSFDKLDFTWEKGVCRLVVIK